MYTNHSTAAFALRAKWSFCQFPLSSSHDYYGHGSQSCPRSCISCCQSSLYAVPRNPRFIYYGYLLRSYSSWFELQPSRTLLVPRRTLRVRDGGYNEVIGLLAESQRCCRCCKGESFASDDSDFEKSSRKEGSFSGGSRDFLRKERTLRKEGVCNGAREDGSRSKYNSVKNSSFSGDFERRGFERRRNVGETSRGRRKKGYGVGGVDVEEKVVPEVRKYTDNVGFSSDLRNETKRKGFDRRIRDGEENATSWRDSNHEARDQEYVYKEPQVRNTRTSSSSRQVSDWRSRVEDKDVSDWMDCGQSTREDYVCNEQEGFQKLTRSSVSNRYSESKNKSDVRNADRGESSTSLMKRQGEIDKQVIGQADSRKSSLRASNVETVSNSQRWFREEWMKDREESSTSVKNSIQVKGDESTLNDQNETHVSDSRFHASDTERANSSKNNLQIRRDDERASSSLMCFEQERLMKDREESSTSANNLGQVSRDERTQIDRRAVDKVEVNEQYETHASDSRFCASDIERATSSRSYIETRRDDERQSSSLRHFEEERLKCREDKSTSVENLVQMRRDGKTQVNQKASNKMQSNEQYENQVNFSRINASSTEKSSNSISSFWISANEQEEHLTSAVNLVHGVGDNSRVKSEWDSSASEFRRSGAERVSNLQEAPSIRTENKKQTSSSVMVQDKKDSRQSTNLSKESLQSTKTQMGTRLSLHGGSSSVYQVKNDAIESASRYDESSAMYVGEFVDKLRQETLGLDGSEVDKGKTHRKAYQETTAIELGEDDDITRHREKHIEESGRQSSSRSGMKGPSDEMWEVRGMSSQKPSKIKEEPEEPPAAEVVNSNTSPGIAENAISRRSHQSLWTYIADIMKIGWGHRARSHSSTNKSGTRSSSNESISSDTWFSGHEPDENDDETEKKERAVSPKESVPSKKPVEQSQGNVSTSVGTTETGPPSKSASTAQEMSEGGRGRRGTLSSKMTIDQPSVQKGNTTSPSLTEAGKYQMHRSHSPKLEQEFGWQKQPEVTGNGGWYEELKKRNGSPKEPMPDQSDPGPSTSMETMKRASSSKVVILASGLEDFESSAGEKGQRGTLSNVDQSSVLTAGTALSSIPEIGSDQMAGSALPKLEEVTDGEKLPVVGGTEEREGELKRRKLQRNNQVLAEQFEEWEEAYKWESEQRKIDEFFMREALVEANKAADTWEVPVGAVLVQNGKIIARGCNLVEELRDSTAHAEMICIREASNLLRTWRLAETTLYVTLEPCPMCAGAILQARIDTVVWGAPNKLLGADGSWVRLFPTRDGGASSLDPSIQTAGPVHPFHPKITIRRGILATECSDVMQQFFQLRRKKNKKTEQPPQQSFLPIAGQPTKLFRRMHNIFCMMFCL